MSRRKVRNEMARYEIEANLNLKFLISETREVIQALEEFANNIERIDEKYNVEVEEREPQESEDKE